MQTEYEERIAKLEQAMDVLYAENVKHEILIESLVGAFLSVFAPADKIEDFKRAVEENINLEVRELQKVYDRKPESIDEDNEVPDNVTLVDFTNIKGL